jgi:hypothetical protein
MGVDKWEIRTPGPPPAPYDAGMMPGEETIGARRYENNHTDMFILLSIRINDFHAKIFAEWILARHQRSSNQNPAGSK